MNLPNLITLLRIGLIPVFALLYLVPGTATFYGAACIFGLASATDWLDGYLARKLGQTTPFGAFLDPVADKLIVATALMLLVGSHNNVWLTLPAIIIVSREILISALREWMAEMNRRGLVSVGVVGKLKTTFQMVAILLLLAVPPGSTVPELSPTLGIVMQAGFVLIYLAAILTLWSMGKYLSAAGPSLRSGMTSKGESAPPATPTPADSSGVQS